MKDLEKYKIAGEIHKKVRDFVYPQIKPNMKIIDICNIIETKIKEEVTLVCSMYNLELQLNNGVAFPTGISINDVVAHYTPNNYDITYIKENDVIKIDYGVHIDGCIVDSAFTINLNNKYIPLLDASREAVDSIIKEIGVDSRFCELSKLSKEIVESYEVSVNNKIKNITPIDNICGHNIKKWEIHGGKLLYGVPQKDDKQVVSENDIMAIEIFASTGKGSSHMDSNILNYSHYMMNKSHLEIDAKKTPIFNVKSEKTKQLYECIKNNFKTLPFCPRFISNLEGYETNYRNNLKELFEYGVINCYPPLLENHSQALVAQFEESVYIGSNSKIILSQLQ